MRFYDYESREIITTARIYSDWKTFRLEEPENHAETFSAEFFETIKATINGRNDLDIIGMKPAEIEGVLRRIRAKM